MPEKIARTNQDGFMFRVRMGDQEVELNGTREEVLKTLEDLPNLMGTVNKAFESVKPKKVTTLTVKTSEAKSETASSPRQYPKIAPTERYDDAVLKLMETDWGKWRPRTLEELKDALKTNGMDYSGRILAGALANLVKKEKIRRWNTDSGNVYILAEKEALGELRGETE